MLFEEKMTTKTQTQPIPQDATPYTERVNEVALRLIELTGTQVSEESVKQIAGYVNRHISPSLNENEEDRLLLLGFKMKYQQGIPTAAWKPAVFNIRFDLFPFEQLALLAEKIVDLQKHTAPHGGFFVQVQGAITKLEEIIWIANALKHLTDNDSQLDTIKRNAEKENSKLGGELRDIAQVSLEAETMFAAHIESNAKQFVLLSRLPEDKNHTLWHGDALHDETLPFKSDMNSVIWPERCKGKIFRKSGSQTKEELKEKICTSLETLETGQWRLTHLLGYLPDITPQAIFRSKTQVDAHVLKGIIDLNAPFDELRFHIQPLGEKTYLKISTYEGSVAILPMEAVSTSAGLSLYDWVFAQARFIDGWRE